VYRNSKNESTKKQSRQYSQKVKKNLAFVKHIIYFRIDYVCPFKLKNWLDICQFFYFDRFCIAYNKLWALKALASVKSNSWT